MAREARRRALWLLLGAIPAAGLAQTRPPAKIAQVGYLFHGSADSAPWIFNAIRTRLAELGWVEGRNVNSEYRYADRRVERFAELAADLVRREVDVIVAMQTASAHAANRATSQIPIVFATSDSTGLADNLARPEGNLTGVSNIGAALAGKQLEVLREMVPRASRVLAIANPENPSTPAFVRDVQAAARSLGMRIDVLAKRDLVELDRLIRSMATRPDLLLVQNDACFLSELTRVLQLASAHRLPAIYGARKFPAAGGLVSYGANLPATYASLAEYVDKILRGAKPRELPVTQPTKFELVVNVRTAKSMGLVLAPALKARVDEEVE